MPEELPQLGKFVIVEYDGSDLSYPVVACVRNNKAPGYVPPALNSACPDPRYASTHVFTRTVPTHIDDRVWWYFEKLPGATVYDEQYDPLTDTFTIIAKTKKLASTITESNTILNSGPMNGWVQLVEKQAIDAVFAYEVVSLFPPSDYDSKADAREVGSEDRPFSFPATVKMDDFILYSGVLGYTAAFIRRVPHVTKVYFVHSVTRPDISSDIDGRLELSYAFSPLDQRLIPEVITDTGTYFVGAYEVNNPASNPTLTDYLASWVGGSPPAPRVVYGQVEEYGNPLRWRITLTFVQYVQPTYPTIT